MTLHMVIIFFDYTVYAVQQEAMNSQPQPSVHLYRQHFGHNVQSLTEASPLLYKACVIACHRDTFLHKYPILSEPSLKTLEAIASHFVYFLSVCLGHMGASCQPSCKL